MSKLKKMLVVAVAGIMMALAVGCGGGGGGGSSDAKSSSAPAASNGKRIGVAMPTQSSQRWIHDGDNMKKKLEALGYTVDLQYAEDDVQAQVSQIENMITNGANCLVVAAIDSSALVNALDQAKQHNIPVIAYGLRLNFRQEDGGFEGATRLLQIAQEIDEIKTICECGRKATRQARFLDGKIVTAGPDILIDDGTTKIEYRALCPKCYHNYVEGKK